MTRIIAWDFDGVLNRNIVDGRFIWADRLEADLGLPLGPFTDYVFRSGRFQQVLLGRRDIRDLLAEWLQTQDADVGPDALLDYWFARDVHPDPQVMNWVAQVAQIQVIATNNEGRRADYIWHQMGFKTHMERMFAAGPMQAKKPDAAFFSQIEAWAGGSELLLIDDHAPNIAAARERGWQVFHFTDATRADLPGVLGL